MVRQPWVISECKLYGKKVVLSNHYFTDSGTEFFHMFTDETEEGIA